MALWSGTARETAALAAAVARHCSCGQADEADCGAHQLLRSQRSVNRLLCYRRIAGRLREEEWRTA
jgi:hypothetical protein